MKPMLNTKSSVKMSSEQRRAAIIKAVRRGLAHLKSLGCVQGTGCLLAVVYKIAVDRERSSGC